MNKLHWRNKKRKIFWTGIIVCIFCFFIYQITIALYKIENLITNKIITVGIVYGVSNSQRNTGGGFKYRFFIKEKVYTGITAYPELPPNFCETLIGRSFPVIYSSKNFDNNDMLITEVTFKKYKMIQPDSLKWIEKQVGKW